MDNTMSSIRKFVQILSPKFYLYLLFIFVYIRLATSEVTPSIILITPQSFRVPTNPSDDSAQPKLQQYVALIRNDDDDLLLKQDLSLQIHDGSQLDGQLFYEKIINFRNSHQLLAPIELDQFSVIRAGHKSIKSKIQQLISVSVRPHKPDAKLNSLEYVRSQPIPVEFVPSHDGRRSFSIIQTDKPIYKPNDKVRIRALVIDETLRPILGDEFKLQVRNPQNVVVEEVRYPRPPGLVEKSAPTSNGTEHKPMFIDRLFEFPPEPMLGTWIIQLLHNDPIANDTTSFEVREYVLPPYEIAFDLPRYILPSTQLIVGSLTAKYHYGKPVRGKVQIKFGFASSLSSKPKYIARTNIKTVDSTTGRVDFKISSDKFKETEWFPSIAGSRLVIEATVTESSTGHRETAQDISSTFISMPYRLSFEDSITDFKPDIIQYVSVQLIDSLTHEPGPAGEKISATYLDKNRAPLREAVRQTKSDLNVRYDSEAVTDHLGRALFCIGPIGDDLDEVHILFKLTKGREMLEPNIHTNESKSEEPSNIQLATGWHVLRKHHTQGGGWIQLMNKTSTHLRLNDEFVSDVLIRDADIVRKNIYYILTAKGQIIALKTLDADGFVRFKVTEAMVPMVRLVVFLPMSQSVLSDSMKINVDHSTSCSLALDYKSKSQSTDLILPNDQGSLIIQAQEGDLVSLIGVDSAVYTLNNRTKLNSSRMIERIRRLDAGCGFGGGQDDLDVFHNAGLMIFGQNVSVQFERFVSPILGSLCQTIYNQVRFLDDAQMGYTKPAFTQLAKVSAMESNRRHGDRSKRDVDLESVLRPYQDPIHRLCCKLGTLEDLPHHRNCSARTKIVQKYTHQEGFKSCAKIYQTCCYHAIGEEIRYAALSPINEVKIEPRAITSLQSSQHSSEDILMPNIGQLDQIEARTLIRKDFRETWLFDLVPVVDKSGLATLDVKLPHSLTTWSVSAMSLNLNRSMCILQKALEITTYQEMFIQISVPYKVVQGEQIDLVAKVFNYSPQMQDVLVYMYGVEDICSDAEPGERSDRKRIRVDKQSTQTVLFPIIPLRTGLFPIKIVAVALSSNHSDIVERQLNVVPRGKQVTDETTFSLDPMNQQRRSKRAIQTGNLVDEIDSSRGLQRSRVRLNPSRDSEFIVPQTQECIVSAIGDKLGQAVQTTMLDVENLIRLPHGCGEQVMIYLGPTLYTARYLSSINRLNGDTRWRAIRYIQSGYKRILNFRKENGPFSAFAHREPSIWLTAFVAKLLCQTEMTPFIGEEIHVDRTVVNSALRWLLDAQNTTTGEWTEWNPVYHREMLGGTMRQNVLTAFVVITLNECAHHSQDLIEEIPTTNPLKENVDGSTPHVAQTNGIDSMRLATKSAERSLIHSRLVASREKSPYVLGLISYALSHSNPEESILVLNDLMKLADKSHSRNQIHWRGDNQIETAAYALQAILSVISHIATHSTNLNKQLKSTDSLGADAVSISNWLSSRRSYSGAFESTQDTIVALEALSKYAQLQAGPTSVTLLPQSSSSSPTLHCNVTMSNRTRRSIEFGESNSQILQSFKLNSFDLNTINGDILDITTSGSGLGTMSVKLKYNVFLEEDELCRFYIDSSIEEWHPILSSGQKGKQPMNQLQRDDLEGGKSLLEDNNKNETTIEDDYFKTFDKSMLSELNLIESPTTISEANNKQAVQATSRELSRPKPEVPSLRLRRQALGEFDSRPMALEAETSESWTSKFVSSIKSKLPSWLVPGVKQTTSTPNLLGLRLVSEPNSGEFKGPKSGLNTRRSAQLDNAPILADAPTGIPSGAHLNTLSNQLEYSLHNKSTPLNSTTSVKISPNELARRLVLLLRVCVHHTARRDSEMAIIEVGILSGFKPNEADLREIINDVGTPAMKYELSADGSLVIIYMKYIPNSGQYCLQFRLIRDSLVYNLQSGYIRVYEYYMPRHSCSNFYTPTRVTDLIQTKCDPTGQVCQCASRSLCPATNKLIDLGQIYQVNTTSARDQIVDLMCSDRFDLVSLVRLKHIKHFEVGKMFKLYVKVKSDLKGNLTKIMEAQRKQKTLQLTDSVRKPQYNVAAMHSAQIDLPSSGADSEEDNDTSLDLLSLTIDSSCLRDDSLLLHLAHPTQWKQGGELILFAKTTKLEKRVYRTTKKLNLAGTSRAPVVGPKPKANVWGNKDSLVMGQALPEVPLVFEDAQQLQYSLQLTLDKQAIIHDLTYQAKIGSREAVNNLLLWLELRSRREKWSCQ